MIPGSKNVTITRLGETFTCIERTRDALDWTIVKFEARFGKGALRIVQGTHSHGPLSAGTHDEDDCLDFEIDESKVSWEEAEFFLRDECGMWIWWRHTGTWGARSSWHLHGGWLPPGLDFGATKEQIGRELKAVGWKVGLYVDGGWTTKGAIVATSQIYDYLHRSLGLKNQHSSGADRSRYPTTIKPFDWTAYTKRKADPMGALIDDLTAVATHHGVTRVYAARALLTAAWKKATGTRKARLAASRAPIADMDDPK